jgi:uncharacterized protein with PIN domain
MRQFKKSGVRVRKSHIPVRKTHGRVRKSDVPLHIQKSRFTPWLINAVARVSGRPLLCAGADFSKTDIPVA